MEKTPLISIIIPTFNDTARLDGCISSVSSQLTDDFECIVVDDGSYEEFVTSLRTYENSCHNLFIHYCEHKGASAARNFGILHARGTYVAFLDGDDEMSPGFLTMASGRISSGVDLAIFGIRAKYHDENGRVEKWTPGEYSFASASEFADTYIRRHNLLLYSQCNKLYRRSIIMDNNIRFSEDISFGEDRIFNFDFLPYCHRIDTYNITMFTYNIHRLGSGSSSHIPGYLTKIMELHSRKIECLCNLSTECTEEEKADFVRYDKSKELTNAILRFGDHPEEIPESIDIINQQLQGGRNMPLAHPHYIIILGSSKCGYRVKTALDQYGSCKDTVFVVYGGNKMHCDERTEGEYMKDMLMQHGIQDDHILMDISSRNTSGNIKNAQQIINDYETASGVQAETIVIVTAWFHIRRAKTLVEKQGFLSAKKVYYCPAYGQAIRPDNWYGDDYARSVILDELSFDINGGNRNASEGR